MPLLDSLADSPAVPLMTHYPKILVVGPARTGMGYVARSMQSAFHMRVGHNQVFHAGCDPSADRPPCWTAYKADVSWYAAPWLWGLEDVKVFVLTREPVRTIGSLMRWGKLDDLNSPEYHFARTQIGLWCNLDLADIDPGLPRACAYYHHWYRIILDLAAKRTSHWPVDWWAVESIDWKPGIPKDINEGKRAAGAPQDYDELPLYRREIRDLARLMGYEQEEELSDYEPFEGPDIRAMRL